MLTPATPAQPASAAVVPRLFVDRVLCVSSTDSADDLYMVVFHGHTTPPFASNVGVIGPGNFWDDFDDGETWNQDIFIAGNSPDSVYVVMLVEQDANRDVEGSYLDVYRAQTDLTWKAQMVSLQFANNGMPSTAQQQAGAANAVANAMTGLMAPWPITDDDMIAAKQVVIKPGQTSQLHFVGGSDAVGADYYVTFKIMDVNVP